MSIHGAQQQVTQATTQWPGVTVAPHRFGGAEYQLGTREIGHIHGDTLVDIPFPMSIRNELVGSGQVRPHHVLPDSGWISFFIRQPEDVDQAIDLLRKSYDIAQKQISRRHPTQPADHDTSQAID